MEEDLAIYEHEQCLYTGCSLLFSYVYSSANSQCSLFNSGPLLIPRSPSQHKEHLQYLLPGSPAFLAATLPGLRYLDCCGAQRMGSNLYEGCKDFCGFLSPKKGSMVFHGLFISSGWPSGPAALIPPGSNRSGPFMAAITTSAGGGLWADGLSTRLDTLCS